MQSAGFAIMESMDAAIFNNVVENVRYGVRISVGGAGNEIHDNTFDNCFDGEFRVRYPLSLVRIMSLQWFMASDHSVKRSLFETSKHRVGLGLLLPVIGWFVLSRILHVRGIRYALGFRRPPVGERIHRQHRLQHAHRGISQTGRFERIYR